MAAKDPSDSSSVDKDVLKQRVKELQEKMESYEAEGMELLEFNKELQWTLMMIRKDNDLMRDSLDYLMAGGDPNKIQKEQIDQLIGTSPEKF